MWGVGVYGCVCVGVGGVRGWVGVSGGGSECGSVGGCGVGVCMDVGVGRCVWGCVWMWVWEVCLWGWGSVGGCEGGGGGVWVGVRVGVGECGCTCGGKYVCVEVSGMVVVCSSTSQPTAHANCSLHSTPETPHTAATA